MEYDAITLDTNIFDQNGLRLESGLLAELNQFKNGTAQFILSEVVVKEVVRHIEEKCKKAAEGLDASVRKAKENHVVPSDIIAIFEAIINDAEDTKNITEKRFNAFQEKTGLEIIPATTTNMDAVLKRYFETAAPFEPTGNKKAEFPDAIALLSLEQWAVTNRQKTLIISDDAGWANFAKDSEWLDVEKDLASALAKFQEHKIKVENFISELVRDVEAGTAEISQSINDHIADALESLDIEVDGHSHHRWEQGHSQLTYQDYRFVTVNDQYQTKLVKANSEQIVFSSKVHIKAQVDCEFYIYAWDSIDKEEINLGSVSGVTNEEFEVAILIKLAGEFNDGFEEFDLESLEFLDSSIHIDFGDIDYIGAYEE